MVVVVEEDLCGLADDVAAGDWVAAGVCGVWGRWERVYFGGE